MSVFWSWLHDNNARTCYSGMTRRTGLFGAVCKVARAFVAKEGNLNFNAFDIRDTARGNPRRLSECCC